MVIGVQQNSTKNSLTLAIANQTVPALAIANQTVPPLAIWNQTPPVCDSEPNTFPVNE